MPSSATSKKILFLAYLFPPVGGKGLPGVQRTVKFLRYFDKMDKYVLSVRPDLYPEYFPLEYDIELPINNETIIRTATFDLFRILLKIRKSLLPRRRQETPTESSNVAKRIPSNSSPAVTADNKSGAMPKSLFARCKDIISDLLRFPDFACPWIFPGIRQGRKLIKKEKIDFLFATGLPWSSMVIGWILKRITGAKLIVDFRDPWVNNPYAVKKSKFLTTMENILEAKIVAAADLVSLNTEELKNEFISRYSHEPNNKFIAVYNGYDAYDFRNLPPTKTKGNTNKIILTHAGFLYGKRDPKPILEAILHIQKNAPELAERFIFQQIGNTELEYDLPSYISTKSLSKNYQNLGPLPYSQCLSTLQGADILVIIQQATTTQIPSKIYEYIYLNKPIITISPKQGALASLIEMYDFGYLFTPGEIEKIADLLINLLNKKEREKKITANYKFREKFDIRNISMEFEKQINRV